MKPLAGTYLSVESWGRIHHRQSAFEAGQAYWQPPCIISTSTTPFDGHDSGEHTICVTSVPWKSDEQLHDSIIAWRPDGLGLVSFCLAELR